MGCEVSDNAKKFTVVLRKFSRSVAMLKALAHLFWVFVIMEYGVRFILIST